MKACLLSTGVILTMASLAAAQQPAGNPLRNAKVGDYTIYKAISKSPGAPELDSVIRQVVVAKDDKSVTIKVSRTIKGKEFPALQQTFELADPCDLLRWMGSKSPGKIESDGEGNESIKIGARTFACRWTKGAYTSGKRTGTVKVWISGDVPLAGIVKMETTPLPNVSTVFEFADSSSVSAVNVPLQNKEKTSSPAGNPLRNAEVGDYAIYRVISGFGSANPLEVQMKQIVVAKNDKSVTIKIRRTVKGKEWRPDEQRTVDLTKPLELDLLVGKKSESKFESTSAGSETITIGGKTYICRWTKGTYTSQVGGGKGGDHKVWFATGAPLSGIVKMEMTPSNGVASVLELADSGKDLTVNVAQKKLAVPKFTDNLLRNARVGDFAIYKRTTNLKGSITNTIKQVVAEKDDGSVTIVSHVTSGKDKVTQQFKVDLSQPFNPFELDRLAILSRSQNKFELTGQGNDTLVVAGKSYDCKWTKGKLNGAKFAEEKTAWFSSTAPLTGLARMEVKAQSVTFVIELVASGSITPEQVALDFPLKKKLSKTDLEALKKLQKIDLDVVKAYRKLGASYGHWEQFFGAALNFVGGEKAGALHGFSFAELPKSKLPDVNTSFGLLLGGPRLADDDLKVIAHLKTMVRLQLEESAVSDDGLKHLAGLENLGALNLRKTRVTGEGLKELSNLKKLHTLWLNNSRLTDAGLQHLPPLPELDTIFLSETGITDAGLKHLPVLPKVTTLFLGQTMITDAGLKELARQTTLKKVDVYKTGVTRAGVAELQRVLPGCEVTGGP